jgi:hypothetical protein
MPTCWPAWKDYLARDNHGRGVVLVGHSQGSRILLRLIKEEIDGKPVQKQLVSALILGMNTPVDPAKDAYGSLPLCRKAGQTGCVISYVSFRADVPPPASSKFFGKVAEPGMKAACVNPAALAGGSAPVRSYFADRTIMGTAMRPATVWAKDVDGEDAVCGTAGPGLGRMRQQGRLRLPGCHRAPRQGRPPRRQHPRRPAGAGPAAEGLGAAPGGREPDDGGSGRRGGEQSKAYTAAK